ncbi:MAG: prolyl oligopeptidase family serine peptidase [Deltaproteobacteria bacterium]|nr:prolyl oligopeptidase family serine peptidase [Deltaproteobacteria bacterium]
MSSFPRTLDVATRALATVVLLALGTACSSTSDSAPLEPTPPPTVFGGDRPVTLQVPGDYDARSASPLVISLHGYQSSGLVEELYLRLGPVALGRGYLFLTPDGTFDATNARYWNDWPGDHGGSTVDDVGYLTTLLADVRASYNVDPRRIYLTGHSNGGAMTYRMACEITDTLAAVAVLAGDMPVDVGALCEPKAPLHVLHVHGDKDAAVTYETNAKNLGAEDCVAYWAKHDGCTGEATAPPLDLTKDEPGAETLVTRATGCTGGSVELWTLVGAGHVPTFNATYAETLFDFFDAHPQ